MKFRVISRKSASLQFDGLAKKSTEELMQSCTLKSDAKFEETLTCDSKYDLRNLVNFHPTTQNSENFFSMGSFFVRSIQGLSYKNTEELFFMTLNSDAKFE